MCPRLPVTMMPHSAFPGHGGWITRLDLRTLLRFLPLLVLVAAAAAAPRPVLAADPKQPGLQDPDAPDGGAKTAEGVFAVLDEDGNRRIDRAEWQTRKMAIFYLRDADQNLELSRGEVPGLAQDPFAKADLDRSGSLSGYEFNQAPFSRFEEADADDDVGISVNEFRAYIEGGGTAR